MVWSHGTKTVTIFCDSVTKFLGHAYFATVKTEEHEETIFTF